MYGVTELVAIGLGLVGTLVAVRRYRPGWFAWMAGNWLLFVSTSFVYSVPRFTLTMFPLFAWFAQLAERRWVGLVLAVVSTVLLLWFSAPFATGPWAFDAPARAAGHGHDRGAVLAVIGLMTACRRAFPDRRPNAGDPVGWVNRDAMGRRRVRRWVPLPDSGETLAAWAPLAAEIAAHHMTALAIDVSDATGDRFVCGGGVAHRQRRGAGGLRGIGRAWPRARSSCTPTRTEPSTR